MRRNVSKCQRKWPSRTLNTDVSGPRGQFRMTTLASFLVLKFIYGDIFIIKVITLNIKNDAVMFYINTIKVL